MAKRCYYETLSVDRSANDGAIKTAFRKQAMQYHPDRNPGDKDAERRFKELNEAYEVLKDPDKRAKLISATSVTDVVPQHARIRLRVELARQLKGPIKRHAVLGAVVVLANGRPIARVPLLLAHALPAVSPITHQRRDRRDIRWRPYRAAGRSIISGFGCPVGRIRVLGLEL